MLNGAARLLCTRVVKYVTIEFSNDTRVQKQCDAEKMLRWMRDLKLRISDMYQSAAWANGC